ncbi:NUDIX hydrolase [Streptomyces sp. NPDC052036]|uniref:NUDIX hydrolase n=1 Tax=Streptomyces sp. NPDC052036 TaxID=3155171 RepID=UPI0034160E01
MHARVTGVVIEDDAILLLDQGTEGTRSWSLPGGKVENGETLEEALAGLGQVGCGDVCPPGLVWR